VICAGEARAIRWFYERQFESIDDVHIDGHTSGLTAPISGTVVGVDVEENQFAKAGEVVDLGPHDYGVALE
jgi:multidrug resistance efflux pump